MGEQAYERLFPGFFVEVCFYFSHKIIFIGLSYKQKCNNFGYHSIEIQSKGNDSGCMC